MARDLALETWLRERLRDEPGLGEKAMFGGVAWLIDGRLVCAARRDGMLARVGPERNAWALAQPDVGPMEMRGRPLHGWVRAAPAAAAATRGRLLDAALAFVRAQAAEPLRGRRR